MSEGILTDGHILQNIIKTFIKNNKFLGLFTTYFVGLHFQELISGDRADMLVHKKATSFAEYMLDVLLLLWGGKGHLGVEFAAGGYGHFID